MLKLLTEEWWAPPSGDGAKFKIRGLNHRERLMLREIIESGGENGDGLDTTEFAVQSGVSAWRGVSEDYTPEGWVRRMPAEILDELAIEIFARSALSGEQEKNLSSPSRSRRRESSSTAPTASTAAPAKKKTAKAKTSAGRSKPRRAKP